MLFRSRDVRRLHGNMGNAYSGAARYVEEPEEQTVKIGITGGTGFMGTHLARRLAADSHEVVLISRGTSGPDPELIERTETQFVTASVGDKQAIRDAFTDCDAVAHLAGINFERGAQTYETVHVQGTENIVAASNDVGVSKVILSSFLRARPGCGSAYHESKWQAEEIVRRSGLDYTVFKAGVTYGRGDHLLNHVSRALLTVPVFGLIGFKERRVRPLAIEDLVDCMVASVTEDRLSNKTIPVVGPEELTVEETVQRIGTVIGRDPIMVRLPLHMHYAGAWLLEHLMDVPVVSRAQVRILAEGVVEPAPKAVCDPLPQRLQPTQAFSEDRIEHGIGDRRPFDLNDLRR